ncbi:MAG TPA: glycosyltransferase [Acetobacteraceae bacterium]|nr:glycosyltransferase [Acetobacteraceae bacterium]
MTSPASWPSVSAVIPTRNRPDLLRRAVQSVLDQRYPGALECVVVFDGESPRRPDVTVPPGRSLRTISNDRSPGLAGARNAGAAACDGDLLAWCDDDDEWLPEKLTQQAEAMRRFPDAAVATCGICVCVGNRRFTRSPASDVVPREALLRSRQMWIHSSTLLIRRDCFFGEIGPVDEAIPASYGEDYEWIIRASQATPIVASPEPLVRVYWQNSYYADRWDVMISGIQYHLDKHPELAADARNAARMYGRLAFAYGASGMSRQARRWASRSIRLDWRQPRGYLAMLVSARIISPRQVMALAHSQGRGI